MTALGAFHTMRNMIDLINEMQMKEGNIQLDIIKSMMPDYKYAVVTALGAFHAIRMTEI